MHRPQQGQPPQHDRPHPAFCRTEPDPDVVLYDVIGLVCGDRTAYRKIGARNRAQAAQWAVTHGVA